MRFGTYHVFQCPPGRRPQDVVRDELARAELAETLGYDPTTREMPRGYELYEQRGGRVPEYAYEDWLEHVLLFDDPDGCAEKVAGLRDAGVERLLLWMGVGGVDHGMVVRSMRLFAEEVAPRFRG